MECEFANLVEGYMQPVIMLDNKHIVVAVFKSSWDARLFAKASDHKYCYMPFDINNRDGVPLPSVGSVYKV